MDYERFWLIDMTCAAILDFAGFYCLEMVAVGNVCPSGVVLQPEDACRWRLAEKIWLKTRCRAVVKAGDVLGCQVNGKII